MLVKSGGIYEPNRNLFSRDLYDDDFYTGFNNALLWLFNLMGQYNDIDMILDISTKNYIFVDGLNIVRNNTILLGFLPLIYQKIQVGLFDISLLYMIIQLIHTQLQHEYENKKLSLGKEGYKNIKTILDNILPLILENITKPPDSNIVVVVVQHIGYLEEEKIDPSIEALSSIFTIKQFNGEEDKYETYYYLKLAKIGENTEQSSTQLVPINFIEEPQYIGYAPEYSSKPRLYSKEFAMKGVVTSMGEVPIPEFKTKFEADDVTLVCIIYFMQKIMHKNPNNVVLLSGDNYKWFLDREILSYRLYINFDTLNNFYTFERNILEGYTNVNRNLLLKFIKNGEILNDKQLLILITEWDFLDIITRRKLIETLNISYNIGIPKYLVYKPTVYGMDVEEPIKILVSNDVEMEYHNNDVEMEYHNNDVEMEYDDDDEMEYHNKYLKYKIKYHILRKQLGKKFLI